MSTFTAEQAIQAGLIDELMAEVIQPLPPEEPIIPTKLSGTYTVKKKLLEGSNIVGYQFVINQNDLNAKSVSGTFLSREEIQKFGEEMKNAGVQVNFVDDYPNILRITADEAIKRNLINYVGNGVTKLQGNFEVSEGVATFKQEPFLVKSNYDDSVDFKKEALFTTIDELAKMIEKFLWLNNFMKETIASLEGIGLLHRDLNRNNLGYSQATRDSLTPKPNLSERAVERNPAFWADTQKNIEQLQELNNRSKYSKELSNLFGVQGLKRFKSLQVPRLRHRF